MSGGDGRGPVIQVWDNGGQASGNVNGTSGKVALHQVVVRIKQRAGLGYGIHLTGIFITITRGVW
ncbi:hypothetical protein EAO00_26800 [Klebsiella pneumoniae]|nr:hypothetical protein EAO00_26800 [Klebsiella pneumoniae]